MNKSIYISSCITAPVNKTFIFNSVITVVTFRTLNTFCMPLESISNTVKPLCTEYSLVTHQILWYRNSICRIIQQTFAGVFKA